MGDMYEEENDANWATHEEKCGTYHCETCGVQLNEGKELIAGGIWKVTEWNSDPVRISWNCYKDGDKANARIYPNGYPTKEELATLKMKVQA